METNSGNEIKDIKEEENETEESSKIISNEEALDIHMNYLKSSKKNILYSIIQNEQEGNSIIPEETINEKKLDKGIMLYLQDIYNKYYCNEISYILNSINHKISAINEKNKEFLQNKKFIEREINLISQERMDYFNEKEKLDKDLELLTVNAQQNSMMEKADISMNNIINKNNTIGNNDLEDIDITKKKKKLEELKNKYNKLFDFISENKKEFPVIKNKNSMIQGENMVLNEKLKQKQLIWDQIRKENEKIKTVVIKRDYLHIDQENKNDKKEDKAKKNVNSKKIKVSKIGTFLNSMLGKKAK